MLRSYLRDTTTPFNACRLMTENWSLVTLLPTAQSECYRGRTNVLYSCTLPNSRQTHHQTLNQISVEN